jgi:putative phage-type endonuclease
MSFKYEDRNKEKKMINKEQKEQRKFYIGGSDAAAICGLSKWKTAYEVWLDKIGQGFQKEETLPMKVGTMMESIVADLWASQYNKKIKKSNKTLFSKDYPFIGGNIDRLIVGEKSFLEVKTAGERFSKDWDDNKIPLQYLIQCLHYLYVTQYEYCYLGVLIGNSELKSYQIYYKDYQKQIEQIIQKEVEFWNKYVIPKVPPPVIAEDSEILQQQFINEIKGPTQELDLSNDDEVQLLLENLEAYKQDKKKLEEQISEIENKIKIKLGEYQVAKTSRYIIEWKVQERTSLDKEKMISDGIDLAKYEKKSITRIFKFKQIKQEEK